MCAACAVYDTAQLAPSICTVDQDSGEDLHTLNISDPTQLCPANG